MPAPHAVHTTDEVAPVSVAYVPRKQAVHCGPPGALAKEPGAQGWHTEEVPAPGTDEKAPTVHPVHTADEGAAVTELYRPVGHRVHPAAPPAV